MGQIEVRETFLAEHRGLLASYEALRGILGGLEARLKPLGDTSHHQHYVFSDRARAILSYLQPAVELAEATWYEAAFATCRAALEHHLVDMLLFLGDRYRRRLPNVTAEEYERLRASKAADDRGTEDIVDLNYDSSKQVLSITRTGVHEREGDRGPNAMSLSIYYLVVEDFQPFRIPRSARSYVRRLIELPDDVVARHLEAHSDAWFHHLRWDAIKDNLVMNQPCTRREAAHLDVHYTFLGAYAHPVSQHAPEALGEREASSAHTTTSRRNSSCSMRWRSRSGNSRPSIEWLIESRPSVYVIGKRTLFRCCFWLGSAPRICGSLATNPCYSTVRRRPPTGTATMMCPNP